MSFTNPRVSITDPKNKNVQNRPKKAPMPKTFFYTFILVQRPNFLRRKKSHFTIPLNSVHLVLSKIVCPRGDDQKKIFYININQLELKAGPFDILGCYIHNK